MSNIAAGIILHNPDLDRLKENIDAVYNQVDLVLLIDNNSSNIKLIDREYKNHQNIFIIKNENNLGVATALNQVMSFYKSKGYSWVLTLDQDSVCPPNIIEEYQKYMGIPGVAMLSPSVFDRNKNRKILEDNNTHTYHIVDRCITSAALTNVAVWEEIGGFDEIMFIDLVDFEYCKRVISRGYKIIKVNTVILLHEIGHITKRRFLFWEFSVKNHSAIRKYYMARNIIYCAKKHNVFGSVIMGYLSILKLFLLTMLFEKNKTKKGKAIIKGVINGKKLQVDANIA